MGVANKFLAAVQDAGRIYRHLVEVKGEGKIRAGGVDGRDGLAADAGGAADHPGGDCG